MDANTVASLYAAFKTLEREVKEEQLPPGYYKDLTGEEVTIKFPKGTVVEREAGTKGDGIIEKKATQNLYGYTFFAMMTLRLQKFHQWNAIKEAILETVAEALKKGIPSKDEAVTLDPILAAEIEKLQNTLETPKRKEPTPRLCKATKIPATITIKRPK
jgi:hypothetical protein